MTKLRRYSVEHFNFEEPALQLLDQGGLFEPYISWQLLMYKIPLLFPVALATTHLSAHHHSTLAWCLHPQICKNILFQDSFPVVGGRWHPHFHWVSRQSSHRDGSTWVQIIQAVSHLTFLLLLSVSHVTFYKNFTSSRHLL